LGEQYFTIRREQWSQLQLSSHSGRRPADGHLGPQPLPTPFGALRRSSFGRFNFFYFERPEQFEILALLAQGDLLVVGDRQVVSE